MARLIIDAQICRRQVRPKNEEEVTPPEALIAGLKTIANVQDIHKL